MLEQHGFVVLGGRLQEIEAPEIVFGPARLFFDDAFQGLWRERVPGAMERDGDPSAVGMPVSLMAAGLRAERESVADQGADELTSGQRTQA